MTTPVDNPVDNLLRLLLGDNRDVLKEFSTGYFSSVVTDPPAGITMLGAEWDHFDAPGVIAHSDFKAGATGEAHSHGLAGVLQSKGAVVARAGFISFIGEVFREVFRVLKPGGYGLIWALPRTSHWTAIGLEDAGFQVIQVLYHVYACVSDDTEVLTKEDGWVPYHKARLEHSALCYDAEPDTYSWSPVRAVWIYDHVGSMFRIRGARTDQLVTGNHRCLVECGGGYAFQEAATLESEVHVPVLENVCGLRDALSLSELGNQQRAQAVRGARHTSSDLVRVTEEPYSGKVWCISVDTGAFVARRAGKVFVTGNSGYPKTGNSLKPCNEHWILVRKPPERTIAENVEKYGVGNLSIDACRPPSGEGIQGRHPGDLILSHGPECIRLDNQKVKYQKTVARPPDQKNQDGWGHQRTEGLVRHPTDADGFEEIEAWNCAAGCPVEALNRQFSKEGGAARFFSVFSPDPEVDFHYFPKANTEEKDAGTNSLYWKRGEASAWSPATFVEYAELRKKEDEEKAKTGNAVVLCGRGNIHPTAKSIGLMSWLVRLVTPPDGIVLDPFMGSGTTGLACLMENRQFVGIERETCYHTIALSRLEGLKERLKLSARLQALQSAKTAPVPVKEAAPPPQEASTVVAPEPPPLVPGLSLSADTFKKLVAKATKRKSR